jgi:predicted phosphodiesterase
VAAAFVRLHRPQAKFFLVGHTHRPGAFRTPSGVVVINTGSFCRPFGGSVVDLSGDRVIVRSIAVRDGAFHLGGILAEFALADTAASPRLSA